MKFLFCLILGVLSSLFFANSIINKEDVRSNTKVKIVTVSSVLNDQLFQDIDCCLLAKHEIEQVDLNDSIIYLVNKCEDNIVGILARKCNYPDGILSSESSINNDTITTVTITESMGDYFQEYYELIRDSCICKWTVVDYKKIEFEKDSVRTIQRIDIQ
ncbi:hypothetical protein [Plebeiibacterium sediminum]|uniref:Uncharacterized protein n=1 Tax=Plebeiibacterium sediminum TaxID=2992112 RepID=A0AAE3M5I9_9BACT|nr:hypothetical protein [Plebeiobacterium sediminum]MCW3787341.1 hypothetical protein [Plebeiobacterium sediminum]